MNLPDKRETVVEFTRHGETMLILDPRQPGVQVPEHLRGERELRLKVSYRYNTGALLISDEGVRQTLSFNGELFACSIPWASLIAAWCIPTGTACGWDRPPEPAQLVAVKARMKLVSGGRADEPEIEAEPAKPRPAHLRLLH